jgi:hypothetical protein
MSITEQINNTLAKQNFHSDKGLFKPIDSISLPSDFPNLQNWYKQDIILVAGDTIKWEDEQTAENISGSTGIVANPTLLNGLNVIQCDTSGGILGSTGYLTGQVCPITIFGIIKSSNNGVNISECFRSQGNDNDTVIRMQSNINGTFQFFVRDNAGISIVLTSVGTFGNDNDWTIFFCQYDTVTKTSRLCLSNSVTGSELLTGTNAGIGPFTFRTGIGYYKLTNSAAGLTPWQGSLGEFAIFNDYKTNAVLNQLGEYFADRFSLTWVNV